MKHFLSIMDFPGERIYSLLERALEIKKKRLILDILLNKCAILLFEKPSTRTRISFEIAVHEMGGYTLFMTPRESQLGRNEPLKDTARVISRYAHLMVVRTFGQKKLEELAAFSTIPVINALTDEFHPCQVMSDLLTIYERTPDFSNLKIAWVGDGNNMAHSWINASILLPFTLYLACPQGYEPDKEIVERAKEKGAKVFFTYDPVEAVEGAHYVNTDVWASMGFEEEAEKRKRVFEKYQVNTDLLRYAREDVGVLHCLPAHRGEEITDEVMEGPHSLVWDQAENRLHMQKALLEWVVE